MTSRFPRWSTRARALAAIAVVCTLQLTGAVRSVAAQATPAPRSNAGTEEQAILATVQRLFDAMRAKDTAAFRDIFDVNAKLVARARVRTASRSSRCCHGTASGALMASDQRAPWIERAWSPEVRVRGTLATVWAEYDFHFGQTPIT